MDRVFAYININIGYRLCWNGVFFSLARFFNRFPFELATCGRFCVNSRTGGKLLHSIPFGKSFRPPRACIAFSVCFLFVFLLLRGNDYDMITITSLLICYAVY